MKSTAELTEEYIQSHPSIFDCLNKGLINYSALAREISKDLGISKKSSVEAILVASIRFREKNKKYGEHLEKKILAILKSSDFEIKNKITIFILEKHYSEELIAIEKTIRKERGLFYAIEGESTITLVVQEKNTLEIEKKFAHKIIKKIKRLSLINIKSSKEMEDTPGVIAHITKLFFQNGVNIYEMMSCWKDTLIVIDTEDISKAAKFLDF